MLEIKKNEILAPYTSFQIGGAARDFVIVKNSEELIEAVDCAKKNNEEIFILGGGSNVLVSDKGFGGLAIKIENKNYKIEDELIVVGAGLPLSDLVNISKENNLSGLEWAVGIPGTVGGAVRGNAGAYGGNISDIVESVEVIEINQNDNVKCKMFNNNECEFSYRNSVFKKNRNLVIVSVKFKFEKKNKEAISVNIKEISEKRAKRIPTNWKGSAGSFFENPVSEDRKIIDEFETETGIKIKEGRIPAGWLIDRAGLKGKKVGNVMVNEINSNFIVNTGGGTAEEVIILAGIIKQKIREVFNIQLKEEVQMIGF